jgi:hypothetical protein
VTPNRCEVGRLHTVVGHRAGASASRTHPFHRSPSVRYHPFIFQGRCGSRRKWEHQERERASGGPDTGPPLLPLQADTGFDAGPPSCTQRGIPVDEYEALEETAEILSDEDTLAAIRRGLDELSTGEVASLDEVRAEHAARGRS